MKRIVVGDTPNKTVVKDKEKLARENKPDKKPALHNNKAKSIFKRIADIVLEDINVKLGRDRKSRENKMRYDAFMEMCRGLK